MWGTPRDLELIGKMQSTFAPMSSYIEENDMKTTEGLNREPVRGDGIGDAGRKGKRCTGAG